jgi:hypothetical protein
LKDIAAAVKQEQKKLIIHQLGAFQKLFSLYFKTTVSQNLNGLETHAITTSLD